MSKSITTYTDKQTAFLEALPLTSGNIRQAMNIAGYSKEYSQRALVTSLQDDIVKMAKSHLAAHSMKSASELVNVLDNPASLGAKNTIAAAKEILDRAGIIKEETREMASPVRITFYLPEKMQVNTNQGLTIEPEPTRLTVQQAIQGE